MGARTGPSRRDLLAGAALLLASACTGSTAPPPPAPLTADQRLARRVASEVRVLSAAYAATITAHPSTRSRLSGLAAEHELHAAALDGLVPVRTATASAPATTTGPTSPSPSAVPEVPATPEAATAALAEAERAATQHRRGQALRAGPELARLLASIAACEAVHADLVGGR